MALYVVEGPRGVGKTSLINEVKSIRPDVYVLKFDRGKSPWEDMKAQVEFYTTQSGTYIVDRFHFTEFIYRTVEGKQQPYDLLLDIHHKIVKRGGKVFVLHADYDAVVKRLKNRDPERAVPDSRAVWSLYEFLSQELTVVNLQSNSLRDWRRNVGLFFNV